MHGGELDASGDAFTGGLQSCPSQFNSWHDEVRSRIDRDIGGDISAAGEGEGGD